MKTLIIVVVFECNVQKRTEHYWWNEFVFHPCVGFKTSLGVLRMTNWQNVLLLVCTWRLSNINHNNTLGSKVVDLLLDLVFTLNGKLVRKICSFMYCTCHSFCSCKWNVGKTGHDSNYGFLPKILQNWFNMVILISKWRMASLSGILLDCSVAADYNCQSTCLVRRWGLQFTTAYLALFTACCMRIVTLYMGL